jgi:hypothetical protein
MCFVDSMEELNAAVKILCHKKLEISENKS